MNDVTTTEAPRGKNTGPLLIVLLIIIAALGTGAYFYLGQKEEAAAPTTGEAETVAIVNGMEIDSAALDRSMQQIAGAYATQGIDASTPEASSNIREQALDILINRQLIEEAAVKAGITASNEEVETAYQESVTNIGSAGELQTALGNMGLTDAEFRADIKTDILINKYIEQKFGTASSTVTDEEVQAAYDASIASTTTPAPPFEDVEELIRNQLLMEKQQQQISAEIERLRAEATIESPA